MKGTGEGKGGIVGGEEEVEEENEGYTRIAGRRRNAHMQKIPPFYYIQL